MAAPDKCQLEANRLPISLGISKDSILGRHSHPWKSLHPTGTPSYTYLLILVIGGLSVSLCGGGWWWGIGCWIVGAIAPIVVGRWWWRRRRWSCVALAIASLVVGWLAVTRLQSGEKDQSSVKQFTNGLEVLPYKQLACKGTSLMEVL
jgi:hypothetical protein